MEAKASSRLYEINIKNEMVSANSSKALRKNSLNSFW